MSPEDQIAVMDRSPSRAEVERPLGNMTANMTENLRRPLLKRPRRGAPAPADPVENFLYRLVLDDLIRSDGEAAASRLEMAEDHMGGAFALLPCYTAVIHVLDAFPAAGLPLTVRDKLQRLIRHQIRRELSRIPVHADVQWVLAADTSDRTAAHVAALILTKQGKTSLPWLWSLLPPRGAFVLLGANSLDHDAASHPRCQGCLNFAEVSSRLEQNR